MKSNYPKENRHDWGGQKPIYCLVDKPDSRSVIFMDTAINLSHISYRTGITVACLCNTFSGKTQPSIKTAKRIAYAIGMGIGPFLKALDKHTEPMRPHVQSPWKKRNHPPDPASPITVEQS